MSSFPRLVRKQINQQNPSSGPVAVTRENPGYRAATISDTRREILDWLIPSFDSRFVLNTTLLLSGAVAGMLEFVTHLAVDRMKTPPQLHAFLDGSVVTLMTIALVGVLIASARARRKVMLKQIQTASELNHHLRNALQIMAQSHHLPEEKRAQAVFRSIDRIDEALKRLSPMQ